MIIKLAKAALSTNGASGNPRSKILRGPDMASFFYYILNLGIRVISIRESHSQHLSPFSRC